jgi:hypothetical protein
MNDETRQHFTQVCAKHGFLKIHNVSVLIEAMLQYLIDNLDTMTPIQTALFDKPSKPKHPNVDQRLELKIITKDFTTILNAFDTKQGHEAFRVQKFREMLPQAITLYRETNDKELGKLLERAERYVEAI